MVIYEQINWNGNLDPNSEQAQNMWSVKPYSRHTFSLHKYHTNQVKTSVMQFYGEEDFFTQTFRDFHIGLPYRRARGWVGWTRAIRETRARIHVCCSQWPPVPHAARALRRALRTQRNLDPKVAISTKSLIAVHRFEINYICCELEKAINYLKCFITQFRGFSRGTKWNFL